MSSTRMAGAPRMQRFSEPPPVVSRQTPGAHATSAEGPRRARVVWEVQTLEAVFGIARGCGPD
jgi:hypothetical protein